MDPDIPARASARQWVGLAVLALPTFLAACELTLPNLALPLIDRALAPSATQSLWIVDVYGFVLAAALVTMGTVGDRIGHRRLLLAGTAAFGLVSFLASASPNAEALIASRALLGLAGATLMPSSLALTASLFPDPRQRSMAIGLIIATVAGGSAVGPLVGGLLLDHLWWGSAFLVAVPVAVLFLLAGPLALPEHRVDDGGGRVDLTSAALSLATVLAVIYGLKGVASDGPHPLALAAVATGLALGVGFVRRQLRLDVPLVDLRLFRVRTVSASLATLTVGVFVLFGVNYFVAQHLQLVLGMSPLQAGLWTAPSAVGVIAGSVSASLLVRRLPARTVIAAGLVLSVGGLAALTRVSPEDGVTLLVAASVVVSAGLGPMMALTTDLVVSSAPEHRAGSASALSETAPELGGALGIAILGSIGAATYGRRLPDRILDGLPADAAVDASDSLAGAIEVGEWLPAGPGAELVDAARNAFTEGLHLAASVSIAVLAAAVVLVTVLLRPQHPTPRRGGRT